MNCAGWLMGTAIRSAWPPNWVFVAVSWPFGIAQTFSRMIMSFIMRDRDSKMMRALTIAGTLLLTPLLLAQGNALKPVPNLELRLSPGEMVNGVPQTFTFRLINVSQHNVWVPDPTVECSNSVGGYLSLGVQFAPLHPPGSETRGGCVVDEFKPPILVRAQKWKVLAPGEAIEKTASRAQLRYEVELPGTYEFWAEYHPPMLRPGEQETLRERGVDFSVENLTTSHLTFRTKP
jgi:hypothetical protein